MFDLSETCLRKLPIGHFVRFERTPNMNGKMVEAVVWSWSERGALRMGMFDVNTGEYLGDTL